MSKATDATDAAYQKAHLALHEYLVWLAELHGLEMGADYSFSFDWRITDGAIYVSNTSVRRKP